jgi:uncharacterized protein involved in copper resistance
MKFLYVITMASTVLAMASAANAQKMDGQAMDHQKMDHSAHMKLMAEAKRHAKCQLIVLHDASTSFQYGWSLA